MNVADLLRRTAALYPHRPAVLLGEHVVHSYAQLAQRAAALAGFLLDRLKLDAGARIAVWMPNRIEYLEIQYACWFAGMTVVPVNFKLHPRELGYILQDSGASALFMHRDHAHGLEPALAGAASLPVLDVAGPAYAQACASAPATARPAADTAWLFYTSGTTGNPKGVMQTHRNLYAMTLAYLADVDPVHADDATLYAAPMSHGAGMYQFAHTLAGARHVVPESSGFDEAEILDLAARQGPLSLFAAPTMVRRLTRHAHSRRLCGAGLKTIVYGGGPMYVEDLHEAIDVFGQRFVQIYGQGECPMGISVLPRKVIADTGHPAHAARIASVGVAQTGMAIRIDSDDPAHAPGEVLARGDTVMAGYWRNPEATRATLQDGWLRTGDVGVLDGDGFLTLKDRAKDVIISGGSNIYPREVEEVLLRHPAVAEVSVLGSPDPEWGERVVACLVPAAGERPSRRQLDQLCRDHVASFKRPKAYYVLPELPKNHYGKVLKTDLRQRLDALAATAGCELE
ncbi:long-chain fatty acid--CoA ligase [Verticiella sediminum]|uniref:Long-chain fatty acid--CoA ligase n=1 Tax=Verticiella sediminum TaxID=1247510 RepID=A0A556AEB8_9BURK|nr:AMP-binding protein [Verticiella sediminum]TSH91226.1 long-chain fatty acid--CoA ligase [Verticiella sediminum]